MKELLLKVIANYPYIFALVLFLIGAAIVIFKSNLFKKVIGINIMESSVFILFIASGNIRGGAVPIINEAHPHSLYINPLTSALMLTGIVVGVSVTAFALALILRLYKAYNTTDSLEIVKIRNERYKK